MSSRAHFIALRTLREGHTLAASVEPIRKGCLAWVGVHPLNSNWQSTRELLRAHGQTMSLMPSRVHHLQRFEVYRTLIERDIWLATTDILGKTSAFAYDEEELISKLAAWGVRLEQLVSPREVGYPI